MALTKKEQKIIELYVEENLGLFELKKALFGLNIEESIRNLTVILTSNDGKKYINSLKALEKPSTVVELNKASKERVLSDIVNTALTKDDDMLEYDARAALTAIAEHNKMSGDYAPTQVQVQGEVEVTFGYDYGTMVRPIEGSAEVHLDKQDLPTSQMSGLGVIEDSIKQLHITPQEEFANV